MKTEQTESVIDRIRNRIKPENRQFVSKNLEISEQINCLLEKKGWTQKQFAQRLSKNESEVSKWLSGLHNLTLKSICLMEIILEEDIIITPLNASERYSKFAGTKFITKQRQTLGNIPFHKVGYKDCFKKEIA